MKKIFANGRTLVKAGFLILPFVTLSTFALLSVNSTEASAQSCKVKPIVKTCMPSLAPYQYDAYVVKEVAYTAKAKKESIEFAVYSGEDYKLVFCKTELPQEVGITIFDGNPNSKKSKIVYMDESGKKDKFVCNFHPESTGSYFIEYEIPASTAPDQKGCFVVLIGIKE